MSRRPAMVLAIVILFSAGWLIANAPAAEMSNQQLQQQIDRLKAEVEKLRQEQAQRDANPPFTAKDVDRTVDSTLRDADRRSQLLADSAPFLGGWQDNKFTIRSADGNYSFSPMIHAQFRFVTNYNQGPNSAGEGDNLDSGFEYRRLKFGFEGTAFTPKFVYAFIWATDRNNGNPVNEEAWFRYNFADHWFIRVGQYKENVSQEQGVSSRRQLAVERSMLNELLNNGESFVQGVELAYETEQFRATGALTDGYSSRNTNFQDFPSNRFDFGVNGRFEWKFFGNWKDYADFTTVTTDPAHRRDLLVASAGLDASQSGDKTVYRHAVDLMYKSGPWALYGGMVGRYTDNGSSGADTYDCGLILQAAWLLNRNWELYGRYDYTHLDANVASGTPGLVNGKSAFQEITVGANYYFRKHWAKLTFDLVWLPNGSPTDLDALGILANDGGNEFLLRGQFQLLL